MYSAIKALKPRQRPPKPAEAQHVDCPYPEQYGPGYDQTRVCTFDYVSYSWGCTAWQTVSGQCQLVPPKPSEARHVDCPYPEQYGPGYDQTRVCTFNYSTGQYECTDWQTVSGQCDVVPPKPSEAQTIPCQEGYVGSGQQQTRTCNFNYQSGQWECTDWQTVSQDCQPAAFNLLLARMAWTPRNVSPADGASQTWNSNQQDPAEQNPNYSFTVNAKITQSGDGTEEPATYELDVQITVTGPNTANTNVALTGGHVGGSDTFTRKNLDADGKARWTQPTVGFIDDTFTQWRVTNT